MAELVVGLLELDERRHQRLGHVPPAEAAVGAPATSGVGLEEPGSTGVGRVGRFGRSIAGGRARFTNSATLSGSLRGRSPCPAAARRRWRRRRRPRPTSAARAPRWPESSPPARVIGTSRATAATTCGSARRPVPPGCGHAGRVEHDPRRRRRSRCVRGAADAGAPPRSGPLRPVVGVRARAAAWSIFQAGRCQAARSRARRLGRPLQLDRVGTRRRRQRVEVVRGAIGGDRGRPSARSRQARSRGRGARGRPPRRASSARGVPGTRFRPMASAPARTAAWMPASSVMPQIFTNGARAAVDRIVAAAGRRPRRRAPSLARVAGAHQRLADERRIEPQRAPAADRRRLSDPDSAIAIRSSGIRCAQPGGALGIHVERPQVAVVDPDQARVRRQRGVELPLVVRLHQRLEPEVQRASSTSARERRARGAAPARSSTASAPAARRRRAAAGRPRTPWPGPARRPRPGRREILERAAEPVRLAEHGDRRSAAGLVGAGPGDDVVGRRRRSRQPTASGA